MILGPIMTLLLEKVSPFVLNGDLIAENSVIVGVPLLL